jgi:adenylate kinase family enzyme
MTDADRLVDEASVNTPAAEPATRIRTANQRLTDARNAPPLRPLFGCLWETPGIAILAGDTGVGKSVLAVHIAHLITSDTSALLGLGCVVQEPLLYYDFELTDRQFEKRFDGFPFTDFLLTGDTNPAAVDVESFTFDHICADLERTGAHIVVLDNITALALKSTADADVSIGIMKGLKRLQLERGVSSLVLAHTPKLPPGAALTLNHLAGSKHLSNFADSVFFIGRSVLGTRTRYVKQVKNRTDKELSGVLVCELSDEHGHLGFTLLGTDEEARHLAVPAEENTTTARKAPLAEVLAELPACLAQPQSSGRLEAQLGERFDTDERTIRKRLKEVTESGAVVIDSNGRLCTVAKAPQGREIWYSLQPVPGSP